MCYIWRCILAGLYKSCPNCGKIHTHTASLCMVGKKRRNYNTVCYQVHRTEKMKQLSEIVREDSNGLCAVCLEDNVLSAGRVEVHHIVKIKDAPELCYDEDNLVCLCNFHHRMAEVGMIDQNFLRKLVQKRRGNLLKKEEKLA